MVRKGKVETILSEIRTTHNLTLKTIVAFEDGVRATVYVKPLHSGVIANEILASLVGRSLGIKIPDPCLVTLDDRLLADSVGQTKNCFGSLAIEGSGFEQFLVNDTAFFKFISDYEKSFDVAVFDEWILNDDRNAGNLIIDGKDIWFFDHDRCLPDDAMPDRLAGRNVLFDLIQKAYTNERVENRINYYKEKLYGSVVASSISEYLDVCKVNALLSQEEYARILGLLTSRITYLSSFIDTRFCVEQRDLFGEGLL